MKKFVSITKAAVSTLAVFALLCGGVFAFNHAMAEQSEKNIENSGVAKIVLNDTISEQTKALSGENGTANRSSANVCEGNTPLVVWASDYEETVEKMRANPDNSPEYFDDYIRAKWGDRQSETMVAAE